MTQILAVVLVALLAFLTYQVFAPFLVPLAWALVLATIAYNFNARILGKVKRPNLAALITTLLITVVIIVPAVGVGGAFTQQAIQFGSEVRADWAEGKYPIEKLLEWGPIPRAMDWLTAQGVSMDEATMYAGETLGNAAGFLAGQLGVFAKNVVVFLFNLFVTLFATFYLLRDGDKLLDRIRTVMPIGEGQREGLIYMAYNVLYASVMSSFVVAAVQGSLGGILFWSLGVNKALLWGVVMGFLSLLPMLGSWLVWAPVAVSFVFTGEYGKAIVLVAVGAGIIGLVDNILRPLLISGQVELNGLMVFISVMGGIMAFGLIGLILGPILVALGQATLEFYGEKRRAEKAAAAAST